MIMTQLYKYSILSFVSTIIILLTILISNILYPYIYIKNISETISILTPIGVCWSLKVIKSFLKERKIKVAPLIMCLPILLITLYFIIGILYLMIGVSLGRI